MRRMLVVLAPLAIATLLAVGNLTVIHANRGTAATLQSDFDERLVASVESPIALSFGPDGSSQALYYTTYANGGEVRRITYVQGANRAPHAAVSASPSYGDVPLEVGFDGSGSNDPDLGDGVTSYRWNFGDGSPAVETTTPTLSHKYTEAGTYTATLTVRDETGAEDTATARVDAGNRPPEPAISFPTQDYRFKVGERIVLRGSAADPEDGQLADDAGWDHLQLRLLVRW